MCGTGTGLGVLSGGYHGLPWAWPITRPRLVRRIGSRLTPSVGSALIFFYSFANRIRSEPSAPPRHLHRRRSALATSPPAARPPLFSAANCAPGSADQQGSASSVPGPLRLVSWGGGPGPAASVGGGHLRRARRPSPPPLHLLAPVFLSGSPLRAAIAAFLGHALETKITC